jgi:hypothetical protein
MTVALHAALMEAQCQHPALAVGCRFQWLLEEYGEEELF